MAMDETIHEDPFVSIVMCSYNGMPFIKEAIACVVNQTYKNWELIISDDCSTDGTENFLKVNYGDHPKVKLFFQQKNTGYVVNKNFAHRQAKGLYITQLDCDDLCALNKIERQMAVFKSMPDVMIVATGFKRIDKYNRIFEGVTSGRNILIEKGFTFKYPFWFPSLMVHRSVFDAMGYFNEYFSGAFGDDLYWTRTVNRSYFIYCLSEELYAYRDTPNSMTNQYDNVRKLLMPEIIAILSKQQEETGKDWIMNGDFDSLKRQEELLLNSRRFMSEQFRAWAARAIDNDQHKLAIALLAKSFKNNPVNLTLYRTLFYAIRSFFSSTE